MFLIIKQRVYRNDIWVVRGTSLKRAKAHTDKLAQEGTDKYHYYELHRVPKNGFVGEEESKPIYSVRKDG